MQRDISQQELEVNLSNFGLEESPLLDPRRMRTENVKLDDDAEYSSEDFSDTDSEKLDKMVDFDLDPRLLEMHKALKANDKQSYQNLRKQVTLIPGSGTKKSKHLSEGTMMGDINGNMIPGLVSE